MSLQDRTDQAEVERRDAAILTATNELFTYKRQLAEVKNLGSHNTVLVTSQRNLQRLIDVQEQLLYELCPDANTGHSNYYAGVIAAETRHKTDVWTEQMRREAEIEQSRRTFARDVIQDMIDGRQ